LREERRKINSRYHTNLFRFPTVSENVVSCFVYIFVSLQIHVLLGGINLLLCWTALRVTWKEKMVHVADPSQRKILADADNMTTKGFMAFTELIAPRRDPHDEGRLLFKCIISYRPSSISLLILFLLF
jgi:hypothetical protein